MSAIILIVEDNPVTAMMLEFNLKQYGYHTTLAQTAKEALAYLEHTPQTHLIITNVLMPDMDSFESLQVRDVLAPENPILPDQCQVRLEWGLDRSAYQEIAQAFAEQVGAKARQLEGQLVGEHFAGVLPNLQDLSEGTALLGAERVLSLIEPLHNKGKHTPDVEGQVNYALLLQELQCLHEALMFLPLKEVVS